MSSGSEVPDERAAEDAERVAEDAERVVAGAERIVDRSVAHLASAGELVASGRFREAEVEVLRALSGGPPDLRALNLLALVRVKLGRLEEARGTYREIVAAVPADATARRHLGLLALKLEQIDDAIPELEAAARLAPGDAQAWSYLGYAYAKKGEPVPAAAAFRRAGQDALAVELRARGDGSPPAEWAQARRLSIGKRGHAPAGCGPDGPRGLRARRAAGPGPVRRRRGAWARRGARGCRTHGRRDA